MLCAIAVRQNHVYSMQSVGLCVELAKDEGEVHDIHDAWSHLMAYTVSLYWSVTVVTTTGYGDILAEGIFEQCTLAYFANKTDKFWSVKRDSLLLMMASLC